MAGHRGGINGKIDAGRSWFEPGGAREGNGDFSSLSELLTAQAASPAGLSAVNLRVLSPVLRSLLVVEGTGPTVIEAYTLEPLNIQRLSQSTVALSEDHPWLEASKSTRVAVREVLIEGEYSGTLYVYAVSLIVLDRMPASVRERLEIDGEGIGRILIDHQLETRREVLWYGREHVGELREEVRRRTSGEFITRAYRIVHKRSPVALITEKFPVEVNRSLARD